MCCDGEKSVGIICRHKLSFQDIKDELFQGQQTFFAKHVHMCWHAETYMDCYLNTMQPTPMEQDAQVMGHDPGEVFIHPPELEKKAGRPQTKRCVDEYTAFLLICSLIHHSSVCVDSKALPSLAVAGLD